MSPQTSAEPAARAPSAPVVPTDPGSLAIEVRELDKTFRIPTHRVDSFKERGLHPFAGTEYRELRALRELSFDVHRGEFFGIVGRNGSGKSTLLKILASIYRADAGSVRMAGRVAPFIELGVGLNHELTARENIVLNGVMMGLTRREAQRRLAAVLDFAELQEFVDLKLKNYSSGMLVRLAFSVMVQAEADVLLVDEVLAVGDAAFQEKCAEVFRAMRDSDRTVVLVTHDMSAIESYCDRAMLIDNGALQYIGDPAEVARRYYRQNFPNQSEPWGRTERGVPDQNARLIEAWLEDAAGNRASAIDTGERVRFHAILEARRDLLNPEFGFECKNVNQVTVFSFKRSLGSAPAGPARLDAGERARIAVGVDNTLAPGTYTMRCWVIRDLAGGEIAMQIIDVLEFEVVGTESGPGVVSVRAEVEITAEEGARE
jgi:ABC-type polysaccharide/polyol phosphate transport system ATPase subunit